MIIEAAKGYRERAMDSIVDRGWRVDDDLEATMQETYVG